MILGDFQRWVHLRNLAQELAQLHGAGLQNLEALTHLGRENLLLREILMEAG